MILVIVQTTRVLSVIIFKYLFGMAFLSFSFYTSNIKVIEVEQLNHLTLSNKKRNIVDNLTYG